MTDPPGIRRQDARTFLGSATQDVVFGQLWTRPAFAPRDRSLATLAILFALRMPEGSTAFHIRRGIANGLQRAEIEELAVQASFYSGWPCGGRALDLIQRVLADQPAAEDESTGDQ